MRVERPNLHFYAQRLKTMHRYFWSVSERLQRVSAAIIIIINIGMKKIMETFNDSDKQSAKTRLGEFLESRGIDINKPFRCLNPEHEDKKPSMSFDSKRNRVKCFSCGANYDIFSLIGIEYRVCGYEMFKKTYEILGISGLSENSRLKSRIKPENRKTSSFIGLSENKSTRYSEPPENQKTSSFIGFSENTSTKYGEKSEIPHYSSEMSSEACFYLAKRGISLKTAEKFNLGFVREWKHPKTALNPNIPHSPRIIVPTSKNSYLARDIRENLTDIQRKYSKIKVGKVSVFNSDTLLTSVKPVFVVEGEFDALSICETGAAAVALGSTAYVGKFLSFIGENRPKCTLIIALDSDNAGKTASVKLMSGLAEIGVCCISANINGNYKDANEFLVADRQSFEEIIRKTEIIAADSAVPECFDEIKSVKHEIADFFNAVLSDIGTPAFSTGFDVLDKTLDGGFYEGLYIIGAVSSLGKTSFMLQIADQSAALGQDVLIFSLEMAKTELMAKSISRQTFIRTFAGGECAFAKTSRDITVKKRYDSFNDKETSLIFNAIEDYYSFAGNVFIFEGVGNIGTSEIRDVVEKIIKQRRKPPVIFIDYLQILAPFSVRMSDKQNTDKSVLELKRLSRDLKVPVIAVSSFNRESYDGKVSMRSFKESGAIEYSSDVLIGLQLKGVGSDGFDVDNNKKKEPRNVELVVLKNRNGETGGRIFFDYYARFNYFREVLT
jgi:replicative DNA helicase